MKPRLFLFAGPNGSGKSTLYEHLRHNAPFAGVEYVNPDEYVKQHGGEIKGARKALRRRRELLKSKASFVTETTLSGNSALKLMKAAKDAGYKVILIYIGTNNSTVNIRSVRDRVAKGGHDVPVEAIIRRRADSIENLPEAIQIADRAHIFHRGTKSLHRVFSAINGIVRPRSDIEPPRWIQGKLRSKILERTQNNGRSR